MLDNTNYSIKVDMWSVGAIISEMLTGETLFESSQEIEQLLSIFRARGTPS